MGAAAAKVLAALPVVARPPLPLVSVLWTRGLLRGYLNQDGCDQISLMAFGEDE